MRFSELIYGNEAIKMIGSPDVEIEGLTYRSQDVKRGWLFAAIPGSKTDGSIYIAEAVKAGAAAIISQSQPTALPKNLSVAVVADSRKALAKASDRFFSRPSRRMDVVGITGTSGKTTTAFLVESILREAGRKPAVVGTVNYRFGDVVRPASVTTPESVDLQSMLAEMIGMGADCAAIEVSSHALHQGRVWGLKFAARAFTNLSRDHLDYHKTMEEYFQAKALFFTDPEFADSGPAVINADDPWGLKLLGLTSASVVAYGIDSLRADVRPIKWKANGAGIVAEIDTPRGIIEIESKMLGRLNLYNILAAVAICEAMNVELDFIRRGVEALKNVPGRLESVPNARGVNVLVDYSHKPEALEKAIETTREFTKGKVFVVFGCGGDRDRGKRPIMGKIAATNADVTVVTSDNPRSEKPMDIISEILVGVSEANIQKINPGVRMNGSAAYWVEPDRREAIFQAIRAAQKGDSVLIAGKGHENYQLIGSQRLHFDDRETALEALKG